MFLYVIPEVISVANIKISSEVYEELMKIKKSEGHRSFDSVLRKLLGLKPFKIEGRPALDS